MMLRRLGAMNKGRFTRTTLNLPKLTTSKFNFSARLKLAKLQQSNKEMFENQANNIRSTQEIHSHIPSQTNFTNQEVLMAESEAAVAKVGENLLNPESEDNKVPNYIDSEQALKNDMQMINYKSKFIL